MVVGSRLTKGVTTKVTTANAATVASIWNLLKSLPSISKLKLGLSLVPKTSKPYAKIKLVLSSTAGLVMTSLIPRSSRAWLRCH